MADISKENYVIRNGVRGEEVRDAIVSALNKMNEENYPVSPEEVRDAMHTGVLRGHQLYDAWPNYGSKSAVQSRGLYGFVLEIERMADIILYGEVE